MTKRCELCGTEFEATLPNRRFCCEKHRAQAERRRKGTPSVEAVCAVCGETFLATPYTVNRAARRNGVVVCSPHCRTVYGNMLRGCGWPSSPVKYAACVECGVVFIVHHGAQITCSETCRAAHKATYQRERLGPRSGVPPGEYICRECGRPFTTTRWHGKKLYCSKRCAEAESNRLYQHKRRAIAREKNAASPAELRAKRAAANGRCHWCGRKVKSLTIDHVVPVSRGGTNEIENLVFACFSCNCKSKRDRLPNSEWSPEDKHGQVLLCLV